MGAPSSQYKANLVNYLAYIRLATKFGVFGSSSSRCSQFSWRDVHTFNVYYYLGPNLNHII